MGESRLRPDRPATTPAAPAPSPADTLTRRRLRILAHHRVRHLGVGEDIDHGLAETIATATTRRPLDGAHPGDADIAVVWFRDGDGDLAAVLAGLVETTTSLIWLFTPAAGRPGHIGDARILSAARAAEAFAEPGMLVRPHWTGTRLHVA
ncbi:DUF3052 family protein [Nocardia thailandica]|uniref:DUF3052 family protein n=1 Tax=Nocardia thailandica TaxID=257275 RepID=A0ABW6PTS0_9NOCA|nr:DUF3052 family protein [Nocardia thailandica]